MLSKKINSYLRSFKEHQGGIRSLQWQSYIAAAKRYIALTESLEITGRTVTDVGCGFGDIIPYLCVKSLDFAYTGVDLVPEFVAEAKKRYPDFQFIAGDYFAGGVRAPSDVVISSGAMNGWAGTADETTARRKEQIAYLFERADEVLAFNMAGGEGIANRPRSRVYYADAVEIHAFCKALAPKTILKSEYHPKDFTILMYK